MSDRKLPRWLRKVNIGYQIMLSLLTATNFALSYIDSHDTFDVPKIYFELCSILLAGMPIVWTKFLDSMKQYQNDLTPSDSIASQLPSRSSTHDSLNLDMAADSTEPEV